ncbi:MAG: hypothetical protein JNK48_28985 [Bryobacterales bacterium]|nr:hypothetical protein [Bryobacterales bacterium]
MERMISLARHPQCTILATCRGPSLRRVGASMPGANATRSAMFANNQSAAFESF